MSSLHATIFIFMHLADTFIQSDLHCIQVKKNVSMCVPWDTLQTIKTTTVFFFFVLILLLQI